ncbi:MAG: LacI family DNA-binding transcriptional regulator [Spirochaetota bacterium]
MRKHNNRVTIKDIACKAGVSKTTVSFAFNSPEKISKATHRKIMQIAQAEGYAPNPVARTLATNRIGTIGILLPQGVEFMLRNPYISEFLQGVGLCVSRRGLSITIVSPVNGSLAGAVNTAAADGFICVGLEQNMEPFKILRARGVPFVTVDVPTDDDVPCVVSDDRDGCRMMMKAVVDAGHRDVAIIGVKPPYQYNESKTSLTSQNRLAGYLDALESSGIPRESVPVYSSHTTIEDGFCTAQWIFSTANPPGAIVCMSDITALGVIRYCTEHGIAVPDDVSVCGFDNIQLSAYTHPALTTVSQNIPEKGRTAAALLLSILDRKNVPLHRTVPTHTVIRQTLSRTKHTV